MYRIKNRTAQFDMFVFCLDRCGSFIDNQFSLGSSLSRYDFRIRRADIAIYRYLHVKFQYLELGRQFSVKNSRFNPLLMLQFF